TGGMAEVFRARVPGQEPTLAKLVAVKRILPSYSKDENFVRLFEKEIGLAMVLNHPNLVKIYDSGVVRNQYFMAMEYVHGKTLNSLSARCADGGVRIPVDFSCYLIREVCKVLAYAHNLEDKVTGKFVGIIHRDISPQNVIFSYPGQVKLFDFGVAKMMARDSSSIGSVQGKPAYMAPEQARGEDLDNRTDIFSLGVVLWELLTGERLFYSEQPLVAIKNVTEKPIVPPSTLNPAVPKVLDSAVMKALQRPLDARYQSAQQFAADLDAILNALCPRYGEAHAAKFISSVLGLLIERENAELYEKMHAKTRANQGRSEWGIELPQGSALSLQPEWRRAVAERAFGGEKKSPEAAPSKPKNIPKDETSPARSHRGEWIAAALAVCAGVAWFANEPLLSFVTTASRALNPESVKTNVTPPPVVSAAPVTAGPPAAPKILAFETPDAPAAPCGGHSQPDCAFANGEPTTFANSCAAESAKAVHLYAGPCNPQQNPDVRFKAFGLVNSDWHAAADNPRAALFDDSLEINLTATNIPSTLRLRAVLLSADGKIVKARDMVATSTVMALGKDLPRGTYNLEVRVLDERENVLITTKTNQPFFLGSPSEMVTRMIRLPGPADRKPSYTTKP
ncbi:MAG: serine/threonine protein kinase, partial [Bdellovibrionota bacterium]